MTDLETKYREALEIIAGWPYPSHAGVMMWQEARAALGLPHDVPKEYIRDLPTILLYARRWQWLRAQEGWPDSTRAAAGEPPEWFDALADAGIAGR